MTYLEYLNKRFAATWNALCKSLWKSVLYVDYHFWSFWVR